MRSLSTFAQHIVISNNSLSSDNVIDLWEDLLDILSCPYVAAIVG